MPHNQTSTTWIEEDQQASEPDFHGKWIDPAKELPEDGDYSVWVAFSNGSVEDMKMVHVQDWIRDDYHRGITVTHWMKMPEPPKAI
tara:strand:- start:330 stop:587 length:258 start_codon:yes stop_codon:yes gene_type:complete